MRDFPLSAKQGRRRAFGSIQDNRALEAMEGGEISLYQLNKAGDEGLVLFKITVPLIERFPSIS